MDLGIEGRRCVVTGGSRGIGLATARLLAAEGARVLVVGRDEAALAEVGEGIATLALDVTAPDAGERVHAAAEEHLGALDVLVNNAGTSRAIPLGELADDDWTAQWELHVMAPMRLMRSTVPGMAERGWGRVVNVCSSSGRRPSLTNAAYSVSKAAQLSLSRTFADAHAGTGVLVNAVVPGAIATPLWMGEGGLADQAAAAKGISRDEALEAQAAKVPIGRLGTDAEVASVIAVLCSERAAFVSGAAWSVDGGSVPGIF